MYQSNQSTTALLMPGAAYVRYSSEMQSESFSLDAQLRQIHEQAERDGVEIVKVYADPAQSAYRKKYRPGINAMHEGARRSEFKILYVHKVDRLARRLEWSLEIVHELQTLDIGFKAVEQPFDLGTPEGKLLFHLMSSLSEFYSDNVSKETHKGKLERSLQGYHNGAVPWGYNSQRIGIRKVGVPDLDKAPVVITMFEMYATGAYSDIQIAEWLNAQGYLTNRGHPFGKDTVRDMLCNSYYAGKIRYRGVSVRPKGVSFRSTPPQMSPGQHQAIVSGKLWKRSQAVRSYRRAVVKSRMNTVRINLLQGLVVCAKCGRRLRIQTPKHCRTYYREDSRLSGYRDCPYSRHSVHADLIDAQVVEWLLSIRLPENWEMLIKNNLVERADPETRSEEIQTLLRLMRENYEHGLYEGEGQEYWQKIISLREQLASIDSIIVPVLNQAAKRLLDLQETWSLRTQKERKNMLQSIIQEVGVDLDTKCVLWVKVCPDYKPIFSVVSLDEPEMEQRFWMKTAN